MIVIINSLKIREYAIYRLSTDETFSSIEKIKLGREHRVAKWMEEGLFSLVDGDYRLTRADLATLGWETSALILWIRDNLIPSLNNSPFRFTGDMIQCGSCSSNLISELDSECYACDAGIYEYTVSVASLVQDASGKVDPLIKLGDICCSACNCPFYSRNLNIRCPHCSLPLTIKKNVRIALKKRIDEKIGEVFGDEIREYKFVV